MSKRVTDLPDGYQILIRQRRGGRWTGVIQDPNSGGTELLARDFVTAEEAWRETSRVVRDSWNAENAPEPDAAAEVLADLGYEDGPAPEDELGDEHGHIAGHRRPGVLRRLLDPHDDEESTDE